MKEKVYKYNHNCYKNCPNNSKIIEEQKLCVDECYSNQFEYNNICYNDCPDNTHRIFINRNICVKDIPENFYFDKNESIYKQCYSTCKKCNNLGNEINNRCSECPENYVFINDSYLHFENCYKKCDKYYYFNESSQFTCTNSFSCPIAYNKFVNKKNKCIDLCYKDDEYKYEYNNSCLKKCPPNTKIYEEEKKCLDDCEQIQFEYHNKCYNNCDFMSHEQKIICDFILKFRASNDLFYLYDLIINNKDSLIKVFDTTLIDDGDDFILTSGKLTFAMTSTKNQHNKINYNITTIDLGKCEDKLKEVYNISTNDS